MIRFAYLFLFLFSSLANANANANANQSISSLGISEILVNSPNEMVVVVTGTYHFGDGDSKLDARKAISEQLKVEASEIFGVAIEHELEIKNTKLTKDRLNTYSIGFLNYKVMEERYDFINQQMVLTSKARVTIDKTHLLNNLDLLVRSSRINELSNENKRLSVKLQLLNKQIKEINLNEKQVRYLVRQREDVLFQLDKNAGSIKSSIDKQRLKASLNQIDTEWKYHKNLIEEGSYNYIINTIQMEIGEPKIIEEDRDRLKISFNYAYEFPPKPLIELYLQYFKSFKVVKNNRKVGYRFYHLKAEYENKPYKNKLMKLLRSKLNIIFSLPNLNKSVRENIVTSYNRSFITYNHKNTSKAQFWIEKELLDHLEELQVSYH